MSLSQYKAFLKTIELSSLTKAAEELGYTQSGITHLLNALEDDCGLRLIVRERKGAYATADGELLTPYFRDICAASERLGDKLNEIKRLETGLVRVAAFNSVSVQWLPDIVARFVNAHPHMDIQLLQFAGNTADEWIEEGRVDCAFTSRARSSQYDVFPLHTDPIVVVLPEGHPLAAKDKVAVEDLIDYPYIKLNDDLMTEARGIAEIFRRHGVRPRVRFTETNDYAIVAMVERKLGYSVLPSMIVEKTSRRIAIRPLASGEERELGLVVKDRTRMSLATREFVRCAGEWIEEKYPDSRLGSQQDRS